MSTTVDKRVVSMEFDNQRFERNIHKSMKSLDEMNDKLKFEDAGKGLKNLTDSLNKTDFSNLENSLSHIEKRFSTIGIIGGSLIHRLTNDAIDAVNSVMHLFTAPIKKMSGMIYNGGLSRAMNIEKAKFQLEGLGVTWTSIFGDIDYAVTNTAYALDSAAVAASQLVASGVQIGNDLTPQLRALGYTGEIGAEGLDSMAVSLKAISGVAAQTSSDYDSIAHIFTTVAGQGRLMTMQLRQLEMRGLNVAAKIGEVIGATEAQVREMVSKGMIDYETFANSMFTLFADHAAEANKTLSGVTANIKAAFSRIGADFINPIIKNEGPLVEMLEQIRKRINYIKKALTDWKRGALLDDKVVADATSILEGITAAIKRFPIQNVVVIMNAVGKIYSGLSAMVKNLKPFFKAIKEDFAELFPKKHTIHDVWVFGEKVKAILSNIKYIHTYTNQVVQVGKDGIMRIVEVTSEKVDPKLDKLRRIIKGLAAVFSILKQAAQVVIAPIKTFIKILFKGDSLFLTATASLGDFLVGVDKFIKDSGIFVKAGEKLSWVVEKVVGGFVRLKDGFLNGMSIMDRRSGKMMDIGSIFAAMTPDMSLVEKLGMGISAAFGFIGNAFTFVKDKISGVVEKFKGLNKAGSTTAELLEGLKSKRSLLEKIPYVIKLALNFVKGKIDAIKEAAPELLEKAKEGFGNLKEAIDPVVTSIGEFIMTLGSDTIKKFIEWFSVGTTIIQNNSDKIGSGFDKVKNVLHDILEFIRTEAANGFETLTSALGNFVNSGYAGKILDFAERLIKMRIGWKFGTFIGQTGLMNERFAGLLGRVSETINKFLHPIRSKKTKKNIFQEIADIMLEVAASIGIITTSILVIANMPQDKLDKATYVLIDLFAMYALLGIAMRKSPRGLNVGGKGLVGMAISIFIIAKAIKDLANGVDDPTKLSAATSAIVTVMGVIMFFIYEISKFDLGTKLGDFTDTTKAISRFMKQTAGALILMSVAISSLYVPIYIFGNMDADVLKQGITVVGGLIAAAMVFSIIMVWLSRGKEIVSFETYDTHGIPIEAKRIGAGDAGVIKQLGKTLTRIAGAMIVLAAGVSAMAVPILIFSKLIDDDVFGQGLEAVAAVSAIAGIAFLLVGLVYGFTKGNDTNKYDVKLIRQLSASIGEIAAGMIVLAGAMTAMYYPVKLFGEMPRANFEQGTKVLYTVLGGVAAFVIAMAVLTKTGSFSKLRHDGAFMRDTDFEITGTLNGVTKVVLGVSAAMIGIAIAMKIMASAMKDIGEVPNFDNAYKAMVTILGSIAAITLIITLIAALCGKGNETKITGISQKFGKGAFKNFFKNVKINLFDNVGKTAKIVSTLVGIASVIVAIGGTIKLISSAMKEIASISGDPDVFWKSVGTVGGIFAAISVLMVYLTLITKFMGKGTTMAVAGTMIAIAASLSILALSVRELVKSLNEITMPAEEIVAISSALGVFTIALGALVALASLPTIGTFVKAGLLAVAGAITLIGAAVFMGGKGFKAFVDGLNKFTEATKQNLPIVISAIDENIGRACKVILKSGALIAGTIVGVIGEALAVVAATSFEFGATAAMIIAGLLAGLASQADILIDGLVTFIAKTIEAVAKTIGKHGGDIVDAIGLLIGGIVNAITEAILGIDTSQFDEYLYKDGYARGEKWADGYVDGLGNIDNKQIPVQTWWSKTKGIPEWIAKFLGGGIYRSTSIRNKDTYDLFIKYKEQREAYKDALDAYYADTRAFYLKELPAVMDYIDDDLFALFGERDASLTSQDRSFESTEYKRWLREAEEFEQSIAQEAEKTADTLEESGEKVESKWPGFLNRMLGGTKIGEVIQNGTSSITGIFQNILPNLNITSVLGNGDGESFFSNLLTNFGVAFMGTDPVGEAKAAAESEKKDAQEAYDAMIAELAAEDNPMIYTSSKVLEDIEAYKAKQRKKAEEEKWRKEHPEEAAAMDERRSKKYDVINGNKVSAEEKLEQVAQLESDKRALTKINELLNSDNLDLNSDKVKNLKAKREELIVEINELGAKTAEVTDVYIGYKDEVNLLNEKIQNGEGFGLVADDNYHRTEGAGVVGNSISARTQEAIDEMNLAIRNTEKYQRDGLKLTRTITKTLEAVPEKLQKAEDDAHNSIDSLDRVGEHLGRGSGFILSKLDELEQKAKRHFDNWAGTGSENNVLDPIDEKVNDSNRWASITKSFKSYNDNLREQPKLAFDIHSPSKEMESDAENVILGWVNGITMSEGYGVSQTRNVFQKIHDAVADVIDQIKNLNTGEDITPTITPVIDIEGVKKQSGLIASALGNNYTIRIASDIDRAVNDIKGGRQEIINAINGINTKLDKLPHLTNNYSIEGVNVNEGTNVADAVELIADTALRLRRV